MSPPPVHPRRFAPAIVATAFLCAITAAGPTAQSPQTPAATQPKMSFARGAKTGMIYFTVKEDAAAEFESALPKLWEALTKSEKPARALQAAGWKMYKLPPVNGSLVYLSIIDPVVDGADYHPAAILVEAFGADAAVAVPPFPHEAARAPVRVGGDIQEPRLVVRVDPRYPPDAIKKKIQGTVDLDAVVATDGSVKNLRVIRGEDILVPAALDAVKQWKYSPTLLAGVPVEVALFVQVIFKLSR